MGLGTQGYRVEYGGGRSMCVYVWSGGWGAQAMWQALIYATVNIKGSPAPGRFQTITEEQ